MRQPAEPTSPISFPVSVSRLPRKGVPVRIEANEKQRATLAEIHELTSLENFRADLLVTPWRRNGVQVEGTVVADIVQACIVTLEPLPSHIDQAVEAVFLPDDSKLGREGFDVGGEIILDAEGPDSPETFSGDSIDIGALAEEFFGLAIDPYPRKGSVSLDAVVPSSVEPAEEGELSKKLKSLLPKS